jgi:hypothetical protein
MKRIFFLFLQFFASNTLADVSINVNNIEKKFMQVTYTITTDRA